MSDITSFPGAYDPCAQRFPLYAMHRPIIHYSTPEGWMNDPNGLVYADGYYHLFYQHFPGGLQHGPMHWGHARSKNLVSWEQLPIALYPDEIGVIFSGCAIVDYQNVSGLGKDGQQLIIAFFTHHRRNETEGQIQCQSIAYSIDGGISFEKYANNPVVVNDGTRNFRDPKVIWHEESQAYIMVIASGRKLMFYRSKNLLKWELTGEFGGGLADHSGILECPDLIRLPVGDRDKWVLIVSLTKTEDDDWCMGYLIGDFDGKVFLPDHKEESYGTFDGGFDNYAAVTFSGVPDERRILLGWMNCWEYADKIPAVAFRGSMTIPRTLSIADTPNGLRLTQMPVHELYANLKKQTIAISKQSAPLSLPLEKTPFVVNMITAFQSFTISFRNENDILLVGFDAEKKRLYCDRSKCGTTEFGPLFGKVLESRVENEENAVDVQIIIDVTSIEIFAFHGKNVLTVQYFTQQPFETMNIDRVEVVKEIDLFE